MKHSKLFSLTLVFTFVSVGLMAEGNLSSTTKLVQFAKNAALFGYNNPQEKVYLHLDNTGYFLGETIWFKAYVVDAVNNTPSGLSKTLYAEILTPEGAILQSKKLPIQNGICSGDFQLMDSLPGGFYEIRAYTRAMMNFGPEVAYSRVLPVFDKPKEDGNYTARKMTNRPFTVPNNRAKPTSKEKINLTFYPEGGSLLKGLNSKVAFKATDTEGRNLNIEGDVVDSDGKILSRIKTQHGGMGAFTVMPMDKPLFVKLDRAKKGDQFPLPVPEAIGCQLSVDATSADSILLNIQSTSGFPNAYTMAMVVTCRGKLIDFKTLTLPSTGFSMSIQRKRLPAGINQFTLYDAQGRIQSERLVFNLPESAANVKSVSAKIDVETDKKSYKPYEAIALELSADTTVTKSGTSVSVSVKDALTSNFGNSDQSTMLTNLLLTSDLKGYIETPTWYFQKPANESLPALDLLMLTQGWRRYNWKKMEGVEPFEVKEPIEEGLVLDGEVRSIILKKPMKDIKVNFWMMQGSNAQQGRAQTDSTGRFYFPISEKYGVWDMNIQTSVESSRKEFRILLNRGFSPQAKAYTAYDKEVWTNDSLQVPVNKDDSLAMLLGEVRYSTELTASNKEGIKEVQLKEVVKIGQRRQMYLEVAARKASINYNVDREVDALQDQGKSEASSIAEFLRDTNPYFLILTGDTPTYRYKSRPVQFKIFSNDAKSESGATNTRWDLQQMVPSDVEKILILEDHEAIRRFDPEVQNDPVVIVLITYPNDYPKEPIGVRKTLYDAYAVSQEFYSPIHQPGTPILEADYRRTLYWNPDVTLDKEGKAKLEFYNNGTCRSMSIQVEGINSKGTLLEN